MSEQEHSHELSPFAVVSLVSGGLGLMAACCAGLFGLSLIALPLAVISIIAGAVALFQQKDRPSSKGLAYAGLASGLITLVASVLLTGLTFLLVVLNSASVLWQLQG